MFSLFATLGLLMTSPTAPLPEIVITKDTVLEKNATIHARLIIKASHIVIDGNGARLVGAGHADDPKSFAEEAVVADGYSHVTLRNLKAEGFKTGLSLSNGETWFVERCDFSGNYNDPEYGWGDGEKGGGIRLNHVSHSVLRNNKALRNWNGLDLLHSHDNQILHNDFSHCSNVCLKMQTSCRNRISDNRLSYGLRIKPGETHARDSTGVLIESGSNDNQFLRNDVRHGGDGIFIRVLNNYVSTGNRFVENDCSYANNNGFEAWSPGNTYLRNRANHCSYGFWLGASDQTVVIGNEAAFNGLPTGHHNAPEPDFGHGGIVFVNGPSSHTLVKDNHCHDNGGGGIVMRGDLGSKGSAWKAFHWIIQNNRLERNRWGIVARFADWVHLANNVSKDNQEPDWLEEVTNLTQSDDPSVTKPPQAELDAPHRAIVGQPVSFDASASHSPDGKPLTFRWDLGDGVQTGSKFTHVFQKPGFYRVGVTVSNGVLADLAYRDLLVVFAAAQEVGTEGEAAKWGYIIEGEPSKMVFVNDEVERIVGNRSLRLSPDPYPGGNTTAIYPAAKNAGWDLTAKKRLVFWMKLQNPNPTGFQNVGPEIRLLAAKGEIRYTPAGDRNFLRDTGYSEGRWMWTRLEIPITGGELWKRESTGEVNLKAIDAISFIFDSFEADPFTVWLDGITFEE